MADWVAYVRRHLRLTGLSETREAEIVEDVARQLEDAHREALASGASEAEALARAERHISDWPALARDLSLVTHGRKPAIDLWSDRATDRAAARGGFTWVGRLMADVRYGVRVMIKTPGFSALAIVMLALGTGANAAVFSVVDAVMLRSPFERPDEIASVSLLTATKGTAGVPRETTARLAALTHVVSATSVWTIGSPIVTGVDEPRRVQMECVQASMADVLGARPAMGRWFTASEDVPASPPVGLVSHVFWRQTLNGDPNVIGRQITLDNTTLTIIGVMRPGFDGGHSRRLRDIWVPFGQVTAAEPRYGCRPPEPTASVLVRVRTGLSIDDATKAANAAMGPAIESDSKSSLRLNSVQDETFDGWRTTFAVLVGAVVAVLLIACANVANLGLARLVSRRREIAVRLALGASRAAIIRQSVVEQLVIAVAGSLAGIGIAWLALDTIVGLLPRGTPHFEVVALNGRVLAASIGVTLLFALGVGLIPAIQASSVRLRSGLADQERGSTGGGRRIRWALVVGELSLGVMLLVGALLMIRTFFTLRLDAPGFDPANKMVALTRLPADTAVDARQQFIGDVSRELLRLPGVGSVVHASHMPISGTYAFLPMSIDGQSGNVFTYRVSANFISTMRMTVLRGRDFNDADGSGAPAVALANESFVRRWLAGREPLDAMVTVGPGMKPMTARRIVGVVNDTRFSGADTGSRPQLFFPITQELPTSTYFIVSATPAGLAALPTDMRQIVTRARPGQLVDSIDRFETLLAGQTASPRMGAWLLGVFGALAVALGAIGLGSTLAWSVVERRREIGVRMALGAAPAAIRNLVLRQTLLLAAIAIAIGLTAAYFASRLIEGWIYGVARTDVVTYALCGASMLAVALIAAYLPTRRATRVDPLQTLRAE